MTHRSTLENKITLIQKYLNILERYQGFSQKEIESNVDLKGAVERYLYLVIQSCIDLAEAIVGYKKLRKPQTLSESFSILEAAGMIPAELKEKMTKMTGFRNIITHDYAELNYDIVYDILKNHVQDAQIFMEKIEEMI